jgi:hypothetical protein
MQNSHVIKVSANGQVRIPAVARARWRATEVLVVDLGDRVVIRPLPADPVGALVGKYRRMPSSDVLHSRSRREHVANERRKTRRDDSTNGPT